MGWQNWWPRRQAVPQQHNAAPNSKASQAAAVQASPMVAWQPLATPRWTSRRYEQLAEQGYRHNPVVQRCVQLLSQLVSTIPVVLYDADGEELTAHPVLELLARPNPTQSGSSLRAALVAHYLLGGNAYLEAVGGLDGFPPRELFVLRPDRMSILPGPHGLPLAYEYKVGQQATRWSVDQISGASAICHFKHFHPTDDWYGLAPIEAALMAIDQHNAASEWNMAMLKNGARPSGALVYAPKEGPTSLPPEQMQRLKDELENYYQGARNSGRPLLLEGGLEWKPLSLNPQEMDWRHGREMAAREIALVFGVPPQLIGVPDAQTYANYQEARLALYEDTVLPLATRLLEDLANWLLPQFHEELRLTLDPDALAALTNRRDTLWEKLGKAEFLTLNEKREALGYGPLAADAAGELR